MRSQAWLDRGQRPGTTLLEVLVAIFISGIGLLALLALFPLGMLEMAQAIRDDRQSQLQDVADDLLAESQQLEHSVSLLRTAYSQWLTQRRADPQQHQALVQILKGHDQALARIEQKVRMRLPRLSLPDRRRAVAVLRLLRDGRIQLAAQQRNLKLIANVQHALNQGANANQP